MIYERCHVYDPPHEHVIRYGQTRSAMAYLEDKTNTESGLNIWFICCPWHERNIHTHKFSRYIWIKWLFHCETTAAAVVSAGPAIARWDIIIWNCFQHYWCFVRGTHQSPGYSPHQGPMMWSFDVFICVSLHKSVNKQSSCQWFEMPWYLWLHCNVCQ